MNSLVNTTSTASLQHKQQESSRWTTPGLRPLAEAPYVAPGVFEKELPSEKRYQMLFPSDPEKRARMKDLDGELEALNQYLLRVTSQADGAEELPGRQRFFEELEKEIEMDYKDLRKEADSLYVEATILGRFEYDYSDNSPAGGMTELEELLRRGGRVLNAEHPDVKAKYGGLFEKTRRDREESLRAIEERREMGEVVEDIERFEIR